MFLLELSIKFIQMNAKVLENMSKNMNFAVRVYLTNLIMQYVIFVIIQDLNIKKQNEFLRPFETACFLTFEK